MDNELAVSYRIRLRSLQWASSLLRQLSHSTDEEAVLVAANWAVGAVYDLSEAYWGLLSEAPKSTTLQDAHLQTLLGGEKVGGLLVARGKMTHELTRVSCISAMRDLPYAFAGLTDWVWAAPSWPTGDRLSTRTEWYGRYVSGRPLWVPLDQAEWWFINNGPRFTTGEAIIEPEGWVKEVAPVFFDADELKIAKQLPSVR